MSTNTFNSIHQYRSLRRRHSIGFLPSTKNTLFLRPATAANSSSSLVSQWASLAATTTSNPSTSSQSTSLEVLREHLAAKDLRQADEETRRLIIAMAGEAAVKRGYVFFSEVQFIPASELRGIDSLWREHSEGRFGYSVQRKIWKKAKKDFTAFFIKVGWMKKLESSEVEQYNYRSFPSEFVWEMEEGTPEGHLPLTNALRGTQLLSCILNHPAFQHEEDEDEQDEVKPLSKRPALLKTNYTF